MSEPLHFDDPAGTLAGAEAFALPENWQAGRAATDGVTFHRPGDAFHQNAVWAEPDEDGSDIFQVSVADPGSFVAGLPRMVAYSRQIGIRSERPEWMTQALQELVEHFSLDDGTERPVITARMRVTPEGQAIGLPPVLERLTTKALTPETTEADIDLGTLQRLYAISLRLREARLGCSQEPLPARTLAELHKLGDGIVAEGVLAASGLLGNYARKRLPAIYRHPITDYRVLAHVPPEMRELPGFRGHFLSAEHQQYNNSPDNLPVQLPFARPLTGLGQFANNLNLAAYLRGDDPVLDLETLRALASAASQGSQTAVLGEGFISRKFHLATMAPAAGDLARKIKDKRPTPTKLALALFGELDGSPQTIAEVRRIAVARIARNPQLAEPVIHEAIGHGWLQPSLGPKAGRGLARVLLTGRDGTYDYLAHNNPQKRAVEICNMIGRAAGIQLEPESPGSAVEMLKPQEYLQGLNRQGSLRYSLLDVSADAPAAEGPQYAGEVTVTIDGTQHKRVAHGRTLGEAFKAASIRIIGDLNLVSDPPPPGLNTEPEHDSINNAFATYTQRHRIRVVPLAHDTSEHAWGALASCHISATDRRGNPYTATGHGATPELAEVRAKKALLDKLQQPKS